MFRDINCVMIPKLPVLLGDRDGLLDIYGSFLSQSFEQSFESDMWTVLKLRPQLSGDLINSHAFAFLVTTPDKTYTPLRYTPEVMAAIERAYPRVETRGPYAVRYPETP